MDSLPPKPPLAGIKPGDIIGCSSNSRLGVVINLATLGIPFWSLSHLGIVIDYEGSLLWAESTSIASRPCFFSGKLVEGVQAHHFIPRLMRYKGKAWRYPLVDNLGQAQSRKLTRFVIKHLGWHYDRIGAFRARGAGFGWLEKRLRKEDLTSVFCSEFVAAALRDVGEFRTGNASKWNPNSLGRELLRRGVTGKPQRLK